MAKNIKMDQDQIKLAVGAVRERDGVRECFENNWCSKINSEKLR